ncbi:thioredoxin domain-containing protein [Cimex lectularius]|uniref:Thioredoxin domain-containing protein n=1 Tax=Cimex lectularius TaxID=79782 RepID=A0A8I6S2C5_CIMLE|nr:thioredoxin domain-containing protein [Cimex lectularius]
MKFLSILFLTLVGTAVCKEDTLDEVSEEELLSLLRNEKYVIVLFSKHGCSKCEELETLLAHMREDLVETLNPWVVKTMNSNMVKLYSPAKEPALVFFRHGVPLLYDGEYNEDIILHTFTESREPLVKELSDSNFESLTQASSGATTGDWFIMFYSNDCIDCQRLQARWEAVAGKLKTRLNVARINRKTQGRKTSRRFEIIEEPTFLFFRLGKMYYYNIPKYDVASFVAFASDWYKNAKSVRVPHPKTPFDDFTQMIADLIREYELAVKSTGMVVALCVLVLVVLKKKGKEEEEPKKSEEKAKSKDSSDETTKKLK